MSVQPWRCSDCRWLTAAAMATHAGSASFPGIHTVAGTRPGGSASPSRLDTTSRLGKFRCDVTAAALLAYLNAINRIRDGAY